MAGGGEGFGHAGDVGKNCRKSRGNPISPNPVRELHETTRLASAGTVLPPRFHRTNFAAMDALDFSLHHELAILRLGLVLLVMFWDAPDKMALHTYLVRWIMRQSAKIIIDLRARNLGESMLARHPAHLASHFRQGTMNVLFPVPSPRDHRRGRVGAGWA